VNSIREIRFRGKRISDGKWIFGDLIQETKGPCKFIISEGQTFQVYEDTVGQYTGKSDFEHTKLFEGDIVQVVAKYEDTRWCIGFDRAAFCFYRKYDVKYKYKVCELSRCNRDYKIIGNVFENPELLT